MMRTSTLTLSLSLSLLPIAPAAASPFILTFTVDSPTDAFDPAVIDPLNPTIWGWFTYEAASISSTITAMTAVDLIISGHRYTLGEIDCEPISSNWEIVGGKVSGVASMVSDTNDFRLIWNTATLTPQHFYYSYPGALTLYRSVSFVRFDVTPAPEPLTLSLFGAGLAGAGTLIRRARNKAKEQS